MRVLYQNKKISYFEKGKGDTIVLLHGFLENKSIWENFVNELAKDFHVVTIDLPGHGVSESLGPVNEISAMADAVNTVLQYLRVSKAIMVGHSMGGYVSLAFAELFQKKTAGVVLFHSHASADTPDAKKNRERTIELIRESRVEFIGRFIPDLFAAPNRKRFADRIEELKKEAHSISKENIISALRGMRDRRDRLMVLRQSDYPVLFIGGRQDKRIPVDKLLAQVKEPSHSELLLLQHTGHMGWLEQEKITMDAIHSFAKRTYGKY